MTKTILITGASSGIGRATARAVVAAGSRVVLFARSADKLAALGEELGESALAAPGDVTRQEDLDKAVRVGIGRFGAIDAVFVNAGLFWTGPLNGGDMERWATLIDVNLTGAVRTVHAVLPHMMERGSGDILFTGSIAGRMVFPNGALYAATKHAIYAFAEGVRKESHDHGVRVCVISPGHVANEIWGVTDPAEARRQADIGDALVSEDIAAIVVQTLSQPANVNIADILVLPSHHDVPSW